MEKIYNKIKTIAELRNSAADLKKKNKKIVHCHGVFDLVHPGHIRHLIAAKKEGDVLLVTLTADRFVKRGPGRPIFNENLRAESLAAIESIDFVCIDHNPTAVNAIKTIKPDVYVKGQEYEKKDKDLTGMIYDEEKAVQSAGGRLAFTHDITFSSSELINNHLDVFLPETRRYLRNIARKYPIDKIVDMVNSAKKLKTLVIGDAIIDQYHYCIPMGKSTKEHLVAYRYVSEESFAGGSLATANNVGSICQKVDLLTVLGEKDTFQDFIQSRLSRNVNPIFFYRPDTGTIIKRRFVSNGVNEVNRKLFEICYMKDDDIPRREEVKIMRHLEKTIRNYDLVVVSDFGHGFLTKQIISLICSKAKYLALNVQTNSANIGFNLVTKYPRANCVCVDELELRYATHDKFGDLRTHAKKVYKELGCGYIIATRGSLGSLSYSKSGGFHETPALSYRVIDAVGAGDAFFAFVAPCFAAGLSQELVSFIGNAVGSLAVQIVCNREPVNYVDLIKFMTRLLK